MIHINCIISYKTYISQIFTLRVEEIKDYETDQPAMTVCTTLTQVEHLTLSTKVLGVFTPKQTK